MGKRAPSDADPASIKETKHFQLRSEDHSTNRMHPIHSEETSGETDESVNLTFPKKLWKMLQSHFQSVWCIGDSICVAIDEEASLKEMPAWEGPWRVFQTDSMKGFHQLQLYAFTKAILLQNIWVVWFVAEEAAAPSAHSKVHQFPCTWAHSQDNSGRRA